jgi:hypothetical protein
MQNIRLMATKTGALSPFLVRLKATGFNTPMGTLTQSLRKAA